MSDSEHGIRFADNFTGDDIGQKCNNAIKDLQEANTGGVVEIPAGSYELTTSIVLDRSNIWLRGQGRGTTLIWKGSGILPDKPNAAIQLGSRTYRPDRLMVSDLTLIGQYQGQGVFVWPNVSVGNILERLSLEKFNTHILWGYYPDENTIPRECAFSGVIRDVMISRLHNDLNADQVGIKLRGAHSVTIDSCWLGGTQNSPDSTSKSRGVVVTNSSNLRLVNCDIEGWPMGNVDLESGCQAVYLGHNYFETVGLNSHDVKICAGTRGIVLDANYHNAATVPVADHAIKIESGANRPVIVNSTFLNTGSYPIFAEDDPTIAAFVAGNNTNHDSVIISPHAAAFLHDTCASNDAVMRIRQINPNGYGLVLIRGQDNNYYALSIQDAAAQGNKKMFFGDGTVGP